MRKILSKISPMWLSDSGRKRILFLLILAGGIILRLYKWNGYGLWFDEAQWLLILKNGLIKTLGNTFIIQKPPFFEFLIYFWSRIGHDEFFLRMLSFLPAIASIFLTYKLGNILFNEKIGIIASFLISFSPMHIYYSQELTHYSLVILLSLFSVYYLIRSLQKNNILSWVAFIIFTSLCLYTSYPSLFLVISENIFYLFSYIRYKHTVKKWLLSQALILLLYFPCLLMLSKQLIFMAGDPMCGWIPAGSLAHIFQELRLFNVGYNAGFAIHLLACLLFTPLFLMGIFFNLGQDAWKVRLLILWFLAPMFLSILFSKITPTFSYRNFIFSLPAYYLLIALGINKMERYGYLVIVFPLILSGFAFRNYYRNIFPYPEIFYRPGVHPRSDNRGASEYIITNFKKGDIAIHTCESTVVPYFYYRFFKNKQKPKNPSVFSGEGYIVMNSRERMLQVSNGYKRAWLVLSLWEPDELNRSPFREENMLKREFDTKFMLLDKKKFEGIGVYLYRFN